MKRPDEGRNGGPLRRATPDGATCAVVATDAQGLSMTGKHASKANAAFKKGKRSLKPWEQAEQAMLRKTERLKALRLARDAEAAAADAPSAAIAPVDEPVGGA
jgi:hypothetical protein